jgi:hypothetical protein
MTDCVTAIAIIENRMARRYLEEGAQPEEVLEKLESDRQSVQARRHDVTLQLVGGRTRRS